MRQGCWSNAVVARLLCLQAKHRLPGTPLLSQQEVETAGKVHRAKGVVLAMGIPGKVAEKVPEQMSVPCAVQAGVAVAAAATVVVVATVVVAAAVVFGCGRAGR